MMSSITAPLLAVALAATGTVFGPATAVRGDDTVALADALAGQSPYTGRWQGYSYRGGAGGHTSFGRITVTFSITGNGLLATVEAENHHTGLAIADSGPVQASAPGSLVIEGRRQWPLELLPSGSLHMRLAPALAAGEIVDVELRPAPGTA